MRLIKCDTCPNEGTVQVLFYPIPLTGIEDKDKRIVVKGRYTRDFCKDCYFKLVAPLFWGGEDKT